MSTRLASRGLVLVALTPLAGLPCAGAADPSLDPPNLRFDAGYTSRLRWDPPAAAATSFGLYRGSIGSAGMRAYDHACELTEPSYRTTRDEDVPPPGEVYYYVVTGFAVDASGRFTTGRLGTDSRGIARPDSTTFTCGPRVHVDPTLAVSGDGSDWAHAYRTLGEALRHAAGSDCGLEVWLKGTLTESEVRYDGAAHPNLSILGGFGGTELRPWQRQPTATPSGGVRLAVPSSARSVRLDGLTDSRATLEGLAGNAVVLRDMRGASRVSISPTFPASSTGTVLVEDGTFDGGGIGITQFAGATGVTVRRNLMRASDISFRVEGGYLDARVSADIVGNRFEGGVGPIDWTVIGSGSWWAYAEIDARIESNVFTGHSVNAIELRAEFLAIEGGEVHNDPLIVGNTFVDIGGSAVLTSAAGWSESWYVASASPTLWDNIVTGCGAAALSEGRSSAASNVTDIFAIGNDLHGNGVLFLDEGTNEVLSAEELNALPGSRDNFELDPLFANPTGGDYRLVAGSPCLDRGHRDRPAGAGVDADNRPRRVDADGNGVAEPDVGAFEYRP